MSFIRRLTKILAASLTLVVLTTSSVLAAPYGCGEFNEGEFGQGGSCAATSNPDSSGGSGGSNRSDDDLANTGQTVWLVRGGAALLIAAGVTIAVITHKRSKKSYKLR